MWQLPLGLNIANYIGLKRLVGPLPGLPILSLYEITWAF